MRIWFACFLMMFAMAEIFQWFQNFSLPLPIYVFGGVFLAIASNADKRIPWPFPQMTARETMPPPETRDRQPSIETRPIETRPIGTLPAAHPPECNPPLSPSDPQLKSYPSISFTIRKPESKKTSFGVQESASQNPKS